MRIGHGKNMGGSINQTLCQWLATQTGDIRSLLRAHLNRVEAWGLATHSVHASGSNFDVFPVPDQSAKQPFCDRAAANVSCADEEDAFHGSQHAASAFSKPKSEPWQVNFERETADNWDFSAARIAAIVTAIASVCRK
jgi:hypothetical protein